MNDNAFVCSGEDKKNDEIFQIISLSRRGKIDSFPYNTNQQTILLAIMP